MLDTDFVLDASARERLLDRFGPDAAPWCDTLPDLVARCCRRWRLELDQALSGGTSRVFIGRQGRRGIVLKLTPDRSVADGEALALHAWAGTPHAADLLDADPDSGALLIEEVAPAVKLSDEPGLPADERIAELLTGLRATAPAALGDLAERSDFLFALVARRVTRPQVSAHVTEQMLIRGHRLATDLATVGGVTGLVHGDLHLGNVLDAGPSRGLVAIDPRPCRGDVTLDAIDWAMGRATTIAELDDRIARLSPLLPDLDPDRIRDWCRATAVIGAVQLLYRRPLNPFISLLLELAASV